MEPKLMGGLLDWPTGPPFCVYPLEPVALMTIEGFLPCSYETPLVAGWEPPCAVGPVPFTGASVDFALLAEAPAAAGGVEDAVLVAFAYDLTGSCAGTAPDCGVVEPEVADALAGVCWAEDGVALVMSGMGAGAREMWCRAPAVETVRWSAGRAREISRCDGAERRK